MTFTFLWPRNAPCGDRIFIAGHFDNQIVLSPVAPVIGPFSFGDHEYTLGMSAQINCIVIEGDLPVDISWTFHGPSSAMAGVETMKFGSRSSVLNIDSVGVDHAGNYTCIARLEADLEVLINICMKAEINYRTVQTSGMSA